MPLELPNLDDRAYNDLVAEALTLIPAYSPEWTNFNASDPGITLVELFAWLTDLLVYRLNRVTDDSTRKFLRLLNGPDWVAPANADLRGEVRQAVLGLRERYRAVTKDDYEFLSTGAFNDWVRSSSASAGLVSRAHCVPQRNLEEGTEADRLARKPEHVSVVILPASGNAPNPQPTDEQIAALFSFLDERRMLTTRLHVTGPFYAHVSAELVIGRTKDADNGDCSAAINAALATFLNPLPATDGGNGWPFGRDVFVSEIYEVLQKIPGIDFITDVMLTSSCAGADVKCVVAAPIWHAEGDLVGLKIEQHHLPVFEGAMLVIAPNDSFEITNLSVTAKTAPGAESSTVKRSIKSTLRNMLHPGLGGPRPGAAQPTDIYISDLQVALKQIGGVTDPVSLVADCVPSGILKQDKNRGAYLHVEAGRVLDWRVEIQLS
jgi:hypothetical protein